jgi:DNA-directed RNA polymerase specialized sigma24 family protein
MSSTGSGKALFAPTRWSLVHRARGESPEARAALSELCEAYWQPVFRVLRRAGRDEGSARESAQEFFAFVLAGGRLEGADPGRGKFRSYLLGALRHFESDQREREGRLKRGGGIAPESLEALEASECGEPGGMPWDDAVFDHEWALAVVRRAMAVVEGDYAGAGRSEWFERLKPALTGG